MQARVPPEISSKNMKKSKGKKKAGPMKVHQFEEANVTVNELANVSSLANVITEQDAVSDIYDSETSIVSGDSMPQSIASVRQQPSIASVRRLPQDTGGINRKPPQQDNVLQYETSTGRMNKLLKLNSPHKPRIMKKTRQELFDTFGVTDYFPVQKFVLEFSEIKLRNSSDKDLSFYGVEQLTDVTFYMLLSRCNGVALDRVTALDLTGCIHITDMGLQWIAQVFPKLSQINLNGCHKVTETGLYHIVTKCKEMNQITLTGTNVMILPKSVLNMTISTEGYPCISPDIKILSNNGAKILGAANYSKPANKDLVKMVVIHGEHTRYSVVRYLTGISPRTLEPLQTKCKLEMTSRFSVNVIECHEVMIDFFISKRGVYVFYVMKVEEVKPAARRIFTHVCHILAKTPEAVFMIIGEMSDCGTMFVESVKNDITALAVLKSKSLQKTVEVEEVLFTKDTFDEQEQLRSAIVLSKSLGVLNIQCAMLDFTKPFKKDSDTSKLFEASLKRVCEIYPEYQELAGPIFSLVMGDSVDKMLSDGILSMEKSTEKATKIMELCQIMGFTILSDMIQDVPVVCQISFLSKLVSKAYTPPTTSTNDGRVMGLDDATPTWTRENLKKEILTFLKEEQATSGLTMLFRLGLSAHPSLFIPLCDLQPQPSVSLDHFFPEIPPFGKKKDMFFTVGYKAECVVPVCLSVLHKLLSLCNSIRRPNIIWRQGFIIQESFVETLFLLNEEKGDCGSVSLYCHSLTTKQPIESSFNKNIQEAVWNTLLHYKIMLEYVLHQYNIVHTLSQVQGKEPGKDLEVAGLISKHHFLKFEEEDDNPSKLPVTCAICGQSPRISALSWALYSSSNKSFLQPGMVANNVTADSDIKVDSPLIVKQSGSVLEMTEVGTVSLQSVVSCTEQNTFTIGILSAHQNMLQVGISLFRKKYYLDFANSCVTLEDAEGKKQGKMSKDKLPGVGDTVTFQLTEMANETSLVNLKIYRNQEMILEHVVQNWSYLPFVGLSSQAKDAVSVVVHPVLPRNTESNMLGEGMRLEAWDIKTPSLMCVATVAKIQKDGKLQIHFDGWGSNYDYVIEPTSTNIHPIGWMDANKHAHKNLSQELQKPNKYGKAFTWRTYLEEEKLTPVPYGWFTPEQIENTPPSLYMECTGSTAVTKKEGDKNGPLIHKCCSMVPNRVRNFERRAFMKCQMNAEMFNFFTVQSSFFCLLPTGLTPKLLRYPSLQFLMDFTQQNVHILCPGIKTEVLHFVDHPGVQLSTPDVISKICGALQLCCLGLLIQENVLPKMCTSLIPGIETMEDKGQFELWMKRLMFMYVGILEPYVDYYSTSKNVTIPKSALDIYESTIKNQELSGMFTESGTYVRCRGHAMSIMPNNELREIPKELFDQFYCFMTKIDFSNNNLETIPENIFEKFAALETLNISGNKLESIPNGMKHLHELIYLDISGNTITKLPSDFDSLKDTLVYLNISDNAIGLPKVVFSMVKLEELQAENVGEIAQHLAEIKNLKVLQTLNIGKNLTGSLPDGLGDLPLTDLDVSGVPWFTGVQFQSFRAFKLMMYNNHVTKAMDEKTMMQLFKNADIDESSTLTPNEVLTLNYEILFPRYPRFGYKELANEKTGGIPAVILRCKTLQRLVLKYHGLTMVPDSIKDLTALSELDLTNNPKLVGLSAELGGLPLKQLHLQKCIALNTPPKEIIARGFVSVMGYLKRLRLGASPCKRTKLMLVGLGGAGKTSLVQSLLNSRYRAYMDHDEPITDGIDITNWPVPIKDGDQLVFSVWDFAGQTVYYNTHQFFLSNRAVYLLLWNVRQGYEHAGLDFWLSSIACHAPKAPIVVVGTHIDKVEKYKLPEDSLKARYPQISGFHYVSSFTGDGIAPLKDFIIAKTLEQKYMGEKIPAAWLTLEQHLIKHREQHNKDILPFQQLDSIGSHCGIFDKEELIQAIQFLHDLGAVQFFDTDFLRSMVVIYPQWIIDVMACLVTVHEGAVKDGRLLTKDIAKVWKDYPAELHPWLLRLTEEFDLTCPIPEKEASIVPCLLPDEEPQYNWPHADPDKKVKESMTIYKFQYLPAGLFNRAQVRLHNYAKGALLWKKGSYLKKNNHIALMLQTDDQEVIVRAQGFRPENFLFIVHEMIETLIKESYAGVKYDYLVPCMDCLNMNVKDPSMVSYQKVQRAFEFNVPFVQCDKFFHILSIQELKNMMPSDKMSDIDNHLRNSVSELMDLTQDTTVNVFFIYTSKNVPTQKTQDKLVNPVTVLEALRKRENFTVSYCDKPETSDMKALSLSMKSATMIVIGMSDEFCDDAECRKLLLYVKDVLRKPVLLLLLGTSKRWQKGDLNMAFGTEVYVDMQNKARYPHKIEELYEAIKKKAAVTCETKTENPECFISYCWSNSHDAIAKGSRKQENALGWEGGDPREVKKFLEGQGVKCWLDVEKVGGVGLFTSIADGLRDAEVMVAFVSDEYAKSKNCVMEFRYGLTTLRIPVIVVVIGTGYQWERSEIGLLAVGHQSPKINFQYNNMSGNLELLKLIQERLKKDGAEHDSQKDMQKQRNVAFQEVLELTQRKFLRHMTTSVASNDVEPFPILIIVDFLSETDRQDWIENTKKRELIKRKSTMQALNVDQDVKEGGEGDNKKTEKNDGESKSVQEPTADDVDVSQMTKTKYCFRVLCENPEGWHMTSTYVPFPDMDPSDEQQFIDNAAPYLGRVYAICKHSNIQLQCLTTPEGKMFTQRIEEITLKSDSDFKQNYLDMQNFVQEQDKNKIMAVLQRSQVNGKMCWLCEEHKLATRSETEKLYQAHLNKQKENIPLPKGEIPDAPVEAEPEKAKATAAPQQRKVFKHQSGTKGKLQRQTSQMCSVM